MRGLPFAPRDILTGLGLALLMAGAILGSTLLGYYFAARSLDGHLRDIIYAAAARACSQPIEQVLVSRLMAEDESQVLTIILSNVPIRFTPSAEVLKSLPEKERKRVLAEIEEYRRQFQQSKATISLTAPDFEIGNTPVRAIEVPPGRRTAYVFWILSPKKPGRFKVAIEALSEKGFSTQNTVLGIVVTDVLGLSPRQAKMLAGAVFVFRLRSAADRILVVRSDAWVVAE